MQNSTAVLDKTLKLMIQNWTPDHAGREKEEGQKDERNRCRKVTALFKELLCGVNALLALSGFSWWFAGAIWSSVGFHVAVMSLLHNLLSGGEKRWRRRRRRGGGGGEVVEWWRRDKR